MKKPPITHCRYCDLYKTCKRTECSRKLMFNAKDLYMAEPDEYDLIRKYERKSRFNDYAHCYKE